MAYLTYFFFLFECFFFKWNEILINEIKLPSEILGIIPHYITSTSASSRTTSKVTLMSKNISIFRVNTHPMQSDSTLDKKIWHGKMWPFVIDFWIINKKLKMPLTYNNQFCIQLSLFFHTVSGLTRFIPNQNRRRSSPSQKGNWHFTIQAFALHYYQPNQPKIR